MHHRADHDCNLNRTSGDSSAGGIPAEKYYPSESMRDVVLPLLYPNDVRGHLGFLQPLARLRSAIGNDSAVRWRNVPLPHHCDRLVLACASWNDYLGVRSPLPY